MKKVVSCRNKNFLGESDGVVGCSFLSKGLRPLVILDEGTVGHSYYIKNVLPADLKYGNEVFGDKWIFQQDGTNPYRDHLTCEWHGDNFLSLTDKDGWSPNNPTLNRLDDSISDELINVIDWSKARSKTSVTV